MSGRFRRLDGGHIVHQNRWIAVREYGIERDGVRGTYSAIERPDAVVVIPLTPSRRTVLLKQFRFPTNASSWELPMGATNDDEPADVAARREIQEEVGFDAADLINIGGYCPAPGLSSQKATVFLAPIDDGMLDQVVRCWSASEEIQEVSVVALPDLAAMIADGRLTDGFSLAGFLLLRLWLDQPHASNG